MGYTPLHQAAQQGQVYVIKILLKHKADPNALTAVSLVVDFVVGVDLC
jgi:ankyrin repeat protein